MPVEMALVGCGGMGLRHVYGYAEQKRYFDSLRISAVCDLHESAATHVADEVERLTGARPTVYTDYDQMLERHHRLDAVDIVSDTRTHHEFAIKAFQAGMHVIVEKPMAVSVSACRRMADTATKTNRVLSVAENYRRDPMNRLAKALLAAGVIGTPQFMLKMGIGGGSTLSHNVGWHARKDYGGGVLIEQGVHETDLMLYFMGEVASVYSETALFAPKRQFPTRKTRLTAFYEHRVEYLSGGQTSVELDQEDSAFSVLRFKTGAIAQYTLTSASFGYGLNVETVHGSTGTLILPHSRSGHGPVLRRENGEPIQGEDLLSLVPEWELDDITAAFWDGERRISGYDLSFEEVDRKLIGMELQEFVASIETGTRPEVDSETGMAAVAIAYATLESGCTKRPVPLAEVLTGSVATYQADIDAGLGLNHSG